ncbi:MAG: sulfotransferase family 2 domain-containing protein [Pseudomonadota bacterium]
MEAQHKSWSPAQFSSEEIENQNISMLRRGVRIDGEIADLYRQHPEKGRILVHVGKCGGGSFRASLVETELSKFVRNVHVHKPPLDTRYKYWLLIRNPLDRTVSAFRWRHKLVVEDRKKVGNQVEQKAFARFSTINDIAEELYDAGGQPNAEVQWLFRGIGHVGTDIHFYLSELLDRANADQIEHVFMQEFLDEDLIQILGAKTNHRRHYNQSSSWRDHLSDRGAKNLRRIIEPDYAIVGRLFAMGKIPPDRIPTLFT